MDASPELFRQWEAQHVAAEQSRMLAKQATERMVARAKARVEAAIRAVEAARRMEVDGVR